MVPLEQRLGAKSAHRLTASIQRDLVGVKYLLANEGFSEIKTGFLFCLLGAKRPLSEMLNLNFIDQKSALEKQLDGMT